MNSAPQRAEAWWQAVGRTALLDTESFIGLPYGLLVPNASLASQYSHLKEPAHWAELKMLVTREAVVDGQFAIKEPDSPWSLGAPAAWTIRNGRARHLPVLTTPLQQSGSIVITKSYSITFTLSSFIQGTVTPRIGSTLGTARSSNGTFTETIIAGATNNIAFVPSADFLGDIDGVSVTPTVAPPDATIRLYACPDAFTANRATIAWETITAATAANVSWKGARWITPDLATSGFDISIMNAAAYADGLLFADFFVRRYWLGEPCRAY